MKSAEQWIQQLNELCTLAPNGLHRANADAVKDLFTAIQSDARAAGIRKAAQECTKARYAGTRDGVLSSYTLATQLEAAILALIEEKE